MSVGVYAAEKTARQRVWIDIEAICALPDPIRDEIQQTVSYENFVEVALEMAFRKHYHLLESFAAELADRLMGDTRVQTVTITCRKPDIFNGNPESVGVRLNRSR